MSLSVRAVERALDILLCFNAEEPIQSLSRIAESVHLSKPTVHRLLATLEKKQFIAKDQATSRYRLGVHTQH
jgi:IclR family transcriptional regulator, KDG regulon repressor